MSINLRPKQLFPSDMSNVTTPIGTNSSINSYEYQSPMEKHLSKLLVEICDKEIEYQKLKSEVDSVLSNDASATDNVAVTCGCCHGSNHMKRRCIDPPCTTSILCGKLKLHKNELKYFDMKKAQMKKLLKEKLSLESECKKCRETIVAMVKSFPQAVKTSLINSNKRAYLTIHDGKFVPLTAKINRDISILQKYYSGKVPNDLEQESALFPAIIEEASKEFKLNSVMVEQKLEERLSSIHMWITVNKSVGVTCNSQLITIDSSPKPHTSTSNCGSNCVNHKHLSQILFLQSPFKSPPTKVSKSTIGVYTPEHQVESIVSNFGKLKSPGKSAHVAACSLSDVDRHTCTKTSTSCVINSLSDQHVKSKPLPSLNQEFSANNNSKTHKSDSRRAKLPLCSEYIHHFQISIHIILLSLWPTLWLQVLHLHVVSYRTICP